MRDLGIDCTLPQSRALTISSSRTRGKMAAAAAAVAATVHKAVLVDPAAFAANPVLATSLVGQFHAMCRAEFPGDELEPLALWLDALRNGAADAGVAPPHKPIEFHPAFVLLLVAPLEASGDGSGTEAPPRVVAGSNCELYPRVGVSLLAYVVVSAEYRGRGLAKVLVEQCRAWTLATLRDAEGCRRRFGARACGGGQWAPFPRHDVTLVAVVRFVSKCSRS
jgi:GNAT superfamily N-acetyltransferase